MVKKFSIVNNCFGITHINKVVIVTGGSKGIGEGCAQVFCSAGAKVVICARGGKAGKSLSKELTKKGPGVCHFEKCDVTKPENIKKVIDKTIRLFKRLDCLINNAGWHPPEHPIDEFSIKDFKNLLQLNLVSVFAACKFALPYLRKTQGSIINISSLVGSIGQEHASTYVATKGGINALTKALAIDEARYGVRVNAVLPAAVVTPLYNEAYNRAKNPKEFVNWTSSWHWLGHCATIEDVGHTCLFLASDSASFITGIEIPVSGGAELGYGKKQNQRQP